MAGLTSAHYLRENGSNPVVYEKSRGIGGRMATRRHSSEIAFDHGAQYIRSRSGEFADFLDGFSSVGTAKVWDARARDVATADDRSMIVGAPTMNSLLRPIAAQLDMRLNTTIASISQKGNEVWIVDDQGGGEIFDFVIVTVPVDQARNLLAGDAQILEQMSDVEIMPCWSLMVAFDEPLQSEFDQWRYVSDELGWIARNGSKPDRPSADCWVVHARPEWSRENLEMSKEQACESLLGLFEGAMQNDGISLPVPIHSAAHRWRYAQTLTSMGSNYAASKSGRIVAGGDWALGARIECAFDSGMAMARHVATALGEPI